MWRLLTSTSRYVCQTYGPNLSGFLEIKGLCPKSLASGFMEYPLSNKSGRVLKTLGVFTSMKPKAAEMGDEKMTPRLRNRPTISVVS